MSLDVDISHSQGDFTLDARFSSEGHLTALFGPSGAGKSTLTNILAGLIRPQRGRVTVDGEVMVDTARGIFVPKHRRRVGYVFQEGRLFPHLSVRSNLLYGRWFSRADRHQPSLDEVVDLLGIRPLLKRRPSSLSGGEKQRVAIGRALLASPRMLLMDEPLASLDDARKLEILPYIERLRDVLKIPIVYVSHGIGEVARLATTLVVLDNGRVAAAGTLGEVTARLDLLALTGGAEAGAVLEAPVVGHDDEFNLTTLRTTAGDLRVPRLALPLGSRARVRIRASDVIIGLTRPEGLSALNVLAGTVKEVAQGEGAAAEVSLDCGGQIILSRLTRQSVAALGLVPGRPVHAILKTVAIDPRGLGGADSAETASRGL
jgi:molybdate transport system ATP-binding protein